MATGKKQIMVGCKLPHGIVLEHPTRADHKVVVRGLNKIVIIGADHVLTPVDDDFWEDWFAANKEFPALTSGALFAAKTAENAAAMVKENKGRKTGFEPKPQRDKAAGIKPASEDE